MGPGCVVGPLAVIGDRTVLHANVIVQGRTEIGPDCQLFPFSCLGTRPQDRKIQEVTPELVAEGWVDGDQWGGRLTVGARNEIREYVTIHGGTPSGRGSTDIGDDNMLLAGSHVGHDSWVGSHVVFTNGSMAAGHARIDDHAILGAMVGIHQFARVGRYAMIGAGSMLSNDAPPFSLVQGDRARLVAVNLVGMRRASFPSAETAMIKRIYRLLFWREGRLADRLANARAFAAGDPLAEEVFRFVESSERGVCSPRGRPQAHEEQETG